jgi:queuine tRNA-ribosyltransferase
MLDVSTAALPESRPRYLMGVGSLPEILDAVALGVDMFDCVLPTRNARNSNALTANGPLRLKNARHTRDAAPLEPDCPCPACRGGHSRAYLRHLLMAREMLGPILVTLHNLTFMQRLMAGIRASLAEGRFPVWRESTLGAWRSGTGADPVP